MSTPKRFVVKVELVVDIGIEIGIVVGIGIVGSIFEVGFVGDPRYREG